MRSITKFACIVAISALLPAGFAAAKPAEPNGPTVPVDPDKMGAMGSCYKKIEKSGGGFVEREIPCPRSYMTLPKCTVIGDIGRQPPEGDCIFMRPGRLPPH